jgi:hypothetical protein
MIYTNLWKLVSNKDTPFNDIQTYLTSPESLEDLQAIATSMATWKLNPVYGVNERWLVQVLVLSSHPMDIGMDMSSDIYKRCQEWIKTLEGMYGPESASMSSSTSNTQVNIDDAFIRKTMTLKVAYEEWKQKDIRDQIYLIVELYLYYMDIIAGYDAYFRMNDMEQREVTSDSHTVNDVVTSTENDTKTTTTNEGLSDSHESLERLEEEVRVWYNVYVDFANKLLSLIKTYVPRNYQQWIDGIARSRPRAEVSNETVKETIRWSYWKDKESQFKNATCDEDRIHIRETLIKEWLDMASASSSSRIVTTTDTQSDEGLVSYLIDTCEKNDKRTAESVYVFLRTEYESRRYSLIQVLSLLFHRWTQIQQSLQTEQKKV